MPIKPERKRLYPDNWKRISFLVRKRADWRCEMCGAEAGLPNPRTRSKVVLTVHHINGDPTDNRRLNLIALCQEHHNRLDQPFRRPKKPGGNLFKPGGGG